MMELTSTVMENLMKMTLKMNLRSTCPKLLFQMEVSLNSTTLAKKSKISLGCTSKYKE